jgi:hypothetical protein
MNQCCLSCKYWKAFSSAYEKGECQAPDHTAPAVTKPHDGERCMFYYGANWDAVREAKEREKEAREIAERYRNL